MSWYLASFSSFSDKHRKYNNFVCINKMITEIKACDTQSIAIARNRQSGAKATPQKKREIQLKQLLKIPGKYKIVIYYHYTPPQGRTSQQSFLATKIFDIVWSLFQWTLHTHKRNHINFQNPHILLFSFLQDNIYFMRGWRGCWCQNDGFILLFHTGIAVLVENSFSCKCPIGDWAGCAESYHLRAPGPSGWETRSFIFTLSLSFWVTSQFDHLAEL